MFPTTIWTAIRAAGAKDADALDRFAREYREPVRRYIRSRGFGDAEADDLTQDVFVRILAGGVLAKVDPAKGRFRSLVLSVATHAMQDRRRRKNASPLEADPPARDPDFDREWILHLADRAMARLRDDPYFDALRAHLAGQEVDRNRLWHARRRLISLIRDEIARTCSTVEELEEEAAYLSQFLNP